MRSQRSRFAAAAVAIALYLLSRATLSEAACGNCSAPIGKCQNNVCLCDDYHLGDNCQIALHAACLDGGKFCLLFAIDQPSRELYVRIAGQFSGYLGITFKGSGWSHVCCSICSFCRARVPLRLFCDSPLRSRASIFLFALFVLRSDVVQA